MIHCTRRLPGRHVAVLFCGMFLSLWITSPSAIIAQTQLIGFATEWDDSFSEWLVYTADGQPVGEIDMRWHLRNDWSEWDYRIGEHSGSITVKWKNDFNLWELRGGNQLITIRTVFRDEWRQWEISSGDLKLDMQSRYANVLEEWEVASDRVGDFRMFTAYEGDLRDWIIEDRLDLSVPLEMKLAMAFIPILYSTPKY